MQLSRLRAETNAWMRETLKDCEFDVAANIGSGEGFDKEGGRYSDYFKWRQLYMVDMIRYKALDAYIDRAMQIVCKVEDLELPDNSVDFVFCIWAFHHFEDKEAALDQICRVLKQGGKVLFGTWDMTAELFGQTEDQLQRRFSIISRFSYICDPEIDYRGGCASVILGELGQIGEI